MFRVYSSVNHPWFNHKVKVQTHCDDGWIISTLHYDDAWRNCQPNFQYETLIFNERYPESFGYQEQYNRTLESAIEEWHMFAGTVAMVRLAEIFLGRLEGK